MRILIVRPGAFGDIVHTLPLAADLAAAGHEVGWLAEDRWSCLLDGSPVVTRVHRLDRAGLRGRRGLAGRLAAVVSIRRQLRGSYDAVIDAQGLAKSSFFSLLSGAPIRVGHASPRAREGSAMLPSRRAPATATHVIDQQRALALPLGVRAAGGWRFALPAWKIEHAWAKTWMAERGLDRPWLLNVGAGWPTKVWPEERQLQFAAGLAAQQIPLIVAWGSPAERAVAERIAVSHGILAPPTTIPQLAGLLAQAAVVVSGDTGPLHLAHALGTPTIGLFGPVPAERNGPRGPAAINLQAPGAAWERRDLSKVAMGAITPEQVIPAAQQVIAHARPDIAIRPVLP